MEAFNLMRQRSNILKSEWTILKNDNKMQEKLIMKLSQPDKLVDQNKLNTLTKDQLIDLIYKLMSQSKNNSDLYSNAKTELKQVGDQILDLLKLIEFMKRNVETTRNNELQHENTLFSEHCKQLSQLVAQLMRQKNSTP